MTPLRVLPPRVELLDRGEALRPRYAVRTPESNMAGATDCFVAAMKFASRTAQLLDCTVVVRETKVMNGRDRLEDGLTAVQAFPSAP